MNSRITISILFVAVLVGSCVPAPKAGPTETTVATPTLTPLPPTVTPSPENAADSEEVSVRVGDYVRALGGQVLINNVEMNASQLVNEIRNHPERFIETQTAKNQTTYELLVVNNVPLAFMGLDNKWRSVRLRDMAEANNQIIASPVWAWPLDDISNYAQYAQLLKEVDMLTVTADLDTKVVFKDFSTADWQDVVRNWDGIKSQLDKGIIPEKYSYNWAGAERIYEFAAQNNMAVRAQHLLSGGDLPEAIKNSSFTEDELMKILEFETSVKVLKFKGKTYSWDVADEMIVTEINKSGNGDWGWWNREVNLDQAVLLIAKTVKRLDPEANTVFTEDHVLEKTFRELEPDHREQFFKFLGRMKDMGAPIDCVDLENNWWIYAMPEKDFMLGVQQKILDMGYCIAAPETTVYVSEYYPTWWIQPSKSQITETPIMEQTQAYKTTAEVYTELPTQGMGLGEIWDKSSWLNYVTGNGKFEEVSDTYASIFDVDGKPKPAYFAVLEVLYRAAFGKN